MSRPAPLSTRTGVSGAFNWLTNPLTVAASDAETNVSVLSEISATRGSFRVSRRREKSGGIVSTPLTAPLRRSAIAAPASA